MPRPKKIEEVIITKETPPIEPEFLYVMEKETNKIIMIDASKEKDFKQKYLHRSGKVFE